MNTSTYRLKTNRIGGGREAGFTLVELIVVISIISILLSISVMSFNSWIVNKRIEAQVKQIAADINEHRLSALTRKQRFSVTLNANSYVFRSYSSSEEPLSAGTVVPGGTRNVAYGLKSDASTFYNNVRLEIDQRGMINPLGTIFLDRSDSASLNCLTINTVRTNIGKINAGWSNCDDR